MVQTFTSVWNELVTFIVGLFTKISALFYTPSAEGTGGSLTFVGTLALITAGVSLMLLVFNLIRSFVIARG